MEIIVKLKIDDEERHCQTITLPQDEIIIWRRWEVVEINCSFIDKKYLPRNLNELQYIATSILTENDLKCAKELLQHNYDVKSIADGINLGNICITDTKPLDGTFFETDEHYFVVVKE